MYYGSKREANRESAQSAHDGQQSMVRGLNIPLDYMCADQHSTLLKYADQHLAPITDFWRVSWERISELTLGKSKLVTWRGEQTEGQGSDKKTACKHCMYSTQLDWYCVSGRSSRVRQASLAPAVNTRKSTRERLPGDRKGGGVPGCVSDER